jgi:hypothetical protein
MIVTKTDDALKMVTTQKADVAENKMANVFNQSPNMKNLHTTMPRTGLQRPYASPSSTVKS